MQEKVNDWNAITEIDEESIRLKAEEVNMQYQALGEVVKLGDLYGVDVRKPAMNAKKLSTVNVAFMAVCRVINGVAYFGRVPIVLDIFAERDLARGTFTESEIQEFVDDFCLELRTVKFAVLKLTTNFTLVTQHSSLHLWLVWVLTVVTVLLKWTTVFAIHLTTSVTLQNQT